MPVALTDWADLVQQLRDQGFDGLDRYEDVRVWLEAKGFDSDNLTDGSGNTYSLKTIHDNRKGRPLDISGAIQSAERRTEVETAVKQAMDAREKALGRFADHPRQMGGNKAHDVDVKVIGDRIAYDKHMGYPPIDEGGFGFFCRDMAFSTPNAAAALGISRGLTPYFSQYQKALRTKHTPPSDPNLEGSEWGPVANPAAPNDTQAQGGALIPEPFAQRIMDHLFVEDSLISRCDRMTTTTSSLTVPISESTAWGTGTYASDPTGGNVEAPIMPADVAEKQVIPMTRESFSNVQLILNKIGTIVPVTAELLEDAIISVGDYVSRKASNAFDYEVSNQIVNGGNTSVGLLSPTILGGTGPVIQTTRNTPAMVKFPDITAMYSTVYAPYRQNSVWLANQSVEPQLLELAFEVRDATDVVGGHAIYLPNLGGDGIAGAPNGTLYGRPIIFHQACPSLGTAGDIGLYDLRQMLTLQKSMGMRSDVSIHMFFDIDTVAYRFLLRHTNHPWMTQRIAPANGTHFMGFGSTLTT